MKDVQNVLLQVLLFIIIVKNVRNMKMEHIFIILFIHKQKFVLMIVKNQVIHI